MRNPDQPFYRWDKDTLILNILGRPQSRVNKFGRVRNSQLEVHVAAVPEQGKATKTLIDFLSAEFGVPKRNIEVVFGVQSVNKQIRIQNPKMLPPMIQRP